MSEAGDIGTVALVKRVLTVARAASPPTGWKVVVWDIVAPLVVGFLVVIVGPLVRRLLKHFASIEANPGPPEADPAAPAFPMPEGGMPVPGDPHTGEQP